MVDSSPSSDPAGSGQEAETFNATTLLLRRLCAGERAAEEQLYRLVFSELHGQAHRLMRRQDPGHTLQTTALVHEAWLKLVDPGAGGWESRAHFLRVASRAMRSVLVDHARARSTEKRGGDRNRFPIDEHDAFVEEPGLTMLALDEALRRLQELDIQMLRVAELRLFAGLSHEEIGRVLGVSTRTVERAWQLARAWLERELEPGSKRG